MSAFSGEKQSRIENQRLLLYLIYRIYHPKGQNVRSMERLQLLVCWAQHLARNRFGILGFNYMFLKRTTGGPYSKTLVSDLDELVQRGFVAESLKVQDITFNHLLMDDTFVKQYIISDDGMEFIHHLQITEEERAVICTALGENQIHATENLNDLFWYVYHELELNKIKVGEVIMPFLAPQREIG